MAVVIAAQFQNRRQFAPQLRLVLFELGWAGNPPEFGVVRPVANLSYWLSRRSLRPPPMARSKAWRPTIHNDDRSGDRSGQAGELIPALR